MRPPPRAVLAELDIDTAIAAHENWSARLNAVIKGTSTEQLQPDVVCLDDRCDLGKWLHGPGRERLGKYPAFTVLVARHRHFHMEASTVLSLAQSGEQAKADQKLQSGVPARLQPGGAPAQGTQARPGPLKLRRRSTRQR